MSETDRNDGQDFRHERSDKDVKALHDPIMREMREPSDGYEPVPLWLIFIFFALIGWGGYYIGQYSGGWSVDTYYLTRGPQAGGEVAEVDPLTLGRRIYNNCRACHQADGQGVAGNYPPLAGSERVLGSPGVLARIMLQGLEGPVVVLGEEYNNVMPGWAGQLTDGQIAAVLTYIRQEWGNSAPPVAEPLIARVREATSDRTRAWTDAELDEIAATADQGAAGADAGRATEDDQPTTP